jgi:hypothetical protein
MALGHGLYNQITGPVAFLRGIYGFGAAKAEQLHETLGDDCFRILTDDPWEVSVGFAEDTYAQLAQPNRYGGDRIIKAVDSLCLWRVLLNRLTYPQPLGAIVEGDSYIPFRESLRTLDETDAIVAVGRAIRDGLEPSFTWTLSPIRAKKNRWACRFRYEIEHTQTFVGGVYAGKTLTAYYSVPFGRRWIFRADV